MHDFGVAVFEGSVYLLLDVHAVTHLCVGGRAEQACHYASHIVVVHHRVVDGQDLVVVLFLAVLAEDVEILFEAVVFLPFEEGDLHHDAVVSEAVDEGVGDALRHVVAVVVAEVATHVKHRDVDVAYAVAHNVDGDDVQTITVLAVVLHVGRVGVLCAKVLPEAQGFGLHPSLLKFDEYEFFRAVGITDSGVEVDAEHGDVVLRGVGVLVGAHLYVDNLAFDESSQQGLGYALVLQQVFEHRVVYGVGNV